MAINLLCAVEFGLLTEKKSVIFLKSKNTGSFKYWPVFPSRAASCSLGGAQASLEAAKGHMFVRKQFNTHLKDFQVRFCFHSKTLLAGKLPGVSCVIAAAKMYFVYSTCNLQWLIWRPSCKPPDWWCGLQHTLSTPTRQGSLHNAQWRNSSRLSSVLRQVQFISVLSKSRLKYFCYLTIIHAENDRLQICDAALQLHGGYGYLKDHPVEQYYRDTRVHQILEGKRVSVWRHSKFNKVIVLDRWQFSCEPHQLAVVDSCLFHWHRYTRPSSPIPSCPLIFMPLQPKHERSLIHSECQCFQHQQNITICHECYWVSLCAPSEKPKTSKLPKPCFVPLHRAGSPAQVRGRTATWNLRQTLVASITESFRISLGINEQVFWQRFWFWEHNWE